MSNATTKIVTADTITNVLWGAPASHCPPNRAVLAFPGTSRKAWPGEIEGVEWCHDCRADGFGFIRARMLAGSERVVVTIDDKGWAVLRAADSDPADLVGECIGQVISGREARQLRDAIGI